MAPYGADLRSRVSGNITWRIDEQDGGVECAQLSRFPPHAQAVPSGVAQEVGGGRFIWKRCVAAWREKEMATESSLAEGGRLSGLC